MLVVSEVQLSCEDRNEQVGGFPRTRQSAIEALKTRDGEQHRIAMDRVIRIYWAPVYKYLRLRWHKQQQEAEDLTQGFFLAAFEREFLAEFDSSKARFRTFLRVCLDRFVAKQAAYSSAQKRGGTTEHLSLDFDFAEGELKGLPLQASVSPEKTFELEWIRSLFARSLEMLKTQSEQSGKTIQYSVFEAYDIEALEGSERPTYQEIANRHDIAVETVTNYLSAMRRDFRRIVLAEIRELTGSDSEYRDEVRAVLGITIE